MKDKKKYTMGKGAFNMSNITFDRKTIGTILVLALPVMMENILQVLVGVIDIYFVGKIGILSIAGVGITNVIMNIYITFLIGISIGSTALISRNIGGGKKKDAENILKHSLIIAIFIGMLIALVNIIFHQNILMFMTKDKDVIDQATPYFLAVAFPAIFLCIQMILSSALRGAGDTKTPLKVAMITNVINIVLDYILIFGIFNFQGLGILGAGLATTLSRFISCLLLIYIMSKDGSIICLDLKGCLKVNKRTFVSIFRIGLPAGVEKLVMRTGQLVYVGMIIKLGTSVYAAYSIAGTISSLTFLPSQAFSVAAATLVGKSLGAKDVDAAEKYGLMSYLVGAAFVSIIGWILFFFGTIIAGIFTSDLKVINLVGDVLKIVGVIEPVACITIVITAALQGAGDTKFPMYLTVFGIWGIRVAGIYYFTSVLAMGLKGVYYAVVVDIVVRGIMLLHRFLTGKWKRIGLNTIHKNT